METCKVPTDAQFETLRIMLGNAIHKALSNMTIDEIKKLDWFSSTNVEFTKKERDEINGE